MKRVFMICFLGQITLLNAQPSSETGGKCPFGHDAPAKKGTQSIIPPIFRTGIIQI